MDRDAYLSEKWFEAEQKLLFGKSWQYGALLEDFKNPGDRLKVEVGHYTLLLLMGKDKVIRAFHGHCRHRGMVLDETSGRSKNHIVCPYHRWNYDLEGNLKGVPGKEHYEIDDLRELGLHKASVAIWKAMVFVHPDPKADSFEDWLGNLPNFMGPHRTELYEELEGTKLVYELKCNWKIFVENFTDGQHLPYLHEKTLDPYDHKNQSAENCGPHWTFYEPLVPEYEKWCQSHKRDILPELLPDKLGAWVHLLFPNLGISETESYWSLIHIIPLTPRTTRLEVRTRSYSDKRGKKRGGWTPGGKARSEKVIKLSEYKGDPLESGDFMLEDIYVCEAIQRSIESPLYKTGPLAVKRELAISRFHDSISSYINKETYNRDKENC